VSSANTAQEVGAEQIRDLAQARTACSTALDVVACDGKYGNCGFLRSVQGLTVAIVVRLRCDRVLYLPAPPPTGKRGRPRVHGASFAFKEPSTWPNPDEVVELQDPLWGRVLLDRWCGPHEKKGADVPYDVVRIRVHQQCEKPPGALWLAWLAPNGKTLKAEDIWRAYEHRWPIEPGLHFRKETLGWTQPMFQSKEVGDRWTELTALATWIVFLARPVVASHPLPWQKPQTNLTSQRVQQSIAPIFTRAFWLGNTSQVWQIQAERFNLITPHPHPTPRRCQQTALMRLPAPQRSRAPARPGRAGWPNPPVFHHAARRCPG
jgi:hypothetical protein